MHSRPSFDASYARGGASPPPQAQGGGSYDSTARSPALRRTASAASVGSRGVAGGYAAWSS